MQIRLREAVMPEENYLAMLMSPTQIANKLGMSPNGVRHLIRNGQIASVKVSGRPYIRREDYEDFARRQGIVL